VRHPTTMIAQTNAVISAKSTYAAGARIQKSRATKVRDIRDADRFDRGIRTRGKDTLVWMTMM